MRNIKEPGSPTREKPERKENKVGRGGQTTWMGVNKVPVQKNIKSELLMYLVCLLWLLAAACGTIINAKRVTRGSSLYSPLRTTTAPLQERARLFKRTFGIQLCIHLAFPLKASRRPWSQRKHESVGENRKKRRRKEPEKISICGFLFGEGCGGKEGRGGGSSDLTLVLIE